MGDKSIEIAALRELKEKLLADKLETQALILSGELLPRENCKSIIGRIYAVYTTQFLTISEAYDMTTAFVIGLNENENKEQILKLRKVISDVSYEIMRHFKKEMIAFINSETIFKRGDEK